MKIILQDGTVLENLKLNGNNFISQEYIDESTFKGKLSKVIIGGDNHNNRDDKQGFLLSHKMVYAVTLTIYNKRFNLL